MWLNVNHETDFRFNLVSWQSGLLQRVWKRAIERQNPAQKMVNILDLVLHCFLPFVCLLVCLGLASLWPTAGFSERSLPKDRQTLKSDEVKIEICLCAVAVILVEKPTGIGPWLKLKKVELSVPTVADIDITAPIDKHHIGAKSHGLLISVSGLLNYLQVGESGRHSHEHCTFFGSTFYEFTLCQIYANQT